MKAAGLALGLAVSGAALAATPPQPPRRPPIERAPAPTPNPAVPESIPAPPPTEPTAVPPQAAPTPSAPSCLGRLQTAGHGVEPVPVPAPAAGASCLVAEPVRLRAIALPGRDGGLVTLPDAPVVSCAFAEAFAPWLREIAAPVAAARLGSPLKAVRTGPGFECRPRNRQAGAKPSAHGLGLALDLAALELADGRTLPVSAWDAAPGDAAPALRAIRQAACAWFTTVLGPGADPFHADHLHLDLQRHGSSDRYRICQ